MNIKELSDQERREQNQLREKVIHYEPQCWIFEMFQARGFRSLRFCRGEWYVKNGSERRISSFYVLESLSFEGRIIYYQCKSDHGYGTTHSQFLLEYISKAELASFMVEHHIKRLGRRVTLKKFLEPL